MPHQRYFTKQLFRLNGVVTIEGTEFHHMHRVMRQKKGESVEVINGQGELATGIITAFGKAGTKAEITLNQIEKSTLPSSPFCFTLCLAFLRPTALEFAIEKAVEMGAHTICLFPAERSEKTKISEVYLQRLYNILVAACKQCGRLIFPQLHIYSTLSHSLLDGQLLLFGDPHEKSLLMDHFYQQMLTSKQVTLLIGPEAGFTDNELTLMRSKGAFGIQFHPYTLRAETAALYGSALITNWLFKQENSSDVHPTSST